MKRYSDEHIAQYRQHYAVETPRLRGHRWQATVDALATESGAQSVLDYGCGQGARLLPCPGVALARYDPGVPAWATEPVPADLVVCLHALEHVEPGCIHAVLRHLWSLTLRLALVVASCQPSSKRLPDGTPWHTLVRPPQWWEAYLARFWPVTPCPVLDPREGYEWACVLRRAGDAAGERLVVP